MSSRPIVALLLVFAWATPSNAQMRGTAGRGSFTRGGFSRGFGASRGSRANARGGYFGSPFFYSDLDSTGAYEDVAAPYPFVIVQQPLVPAEEPPRKIKPLLIEWRGDRYVRLGGDDSAPNASRLDYAASDSTVSHTPAAPTASPSEVTPAMLVYRDGHHEEIADYTIADGIIYVRGNFWQDGAWTKRIPLSAIDPVATLQANQQRGVKFLLPSASNVVVASF